MTPEAQGRLRLRAPEVIEPGRLLFHRETLAPPPFGARDAPERLRFSGQRLGQPLPTRRRSGQMIAFERLAPFPIHFD